MIFDGSSWCDLVKHSTGRVEFVHLRGVTVICEEMDRRVLWSVDASAPLLYLRAAADGNGRVCAIGVGNDDGNAWATIEGGAAFNLGETACPFPVLIFGDSLGWVAYIQKTTGDPIHGVQATFDVIRIHSAGGHEKLFTREMAPGSQGFLYVATDGQPVTQDMGRDSIPGLALPSRADAHVWVGQSTLAATIAIYDDTTKQITPLGTPGGQPPHIIESGGTYYVCSFVNGGAWLSAHRRPFVAPPIDPVDPVDPVDPEEPDVSVRDVPNLISVIEQTKAQYQDAWKNCHKPHLGQTASEEFARRAAYACSLVDPRFGLNGKRGDPNDLSDDCVCFKHDDGRESVIDFGGGAGGDNPSVQWVVVGHYMPPGPPLQLWIRAERVGGPGTPPPVTPPPAGRPFPTDWIAPPDVFLDFYTQFVAGIYARDRFVENPPSDQFPNGTFICSRGAMMFGVPMFNKLVNTAIAANGNRVLSPEQWWGLVPTLVAQAVAHYRASVPPE